MINTEFQNILRNYRGNIPYLSENSTSMCGIIWALSSINGSRTDYVQLSRIGKGEGRFRLLTVVHEVLTSVARVKHSLLQNIKLPTFCNSRIELTLFIDKDISTNLNDHDLRPDFDCAFDRVIYFDDLPGSSDLVSLREYKRLDMLVRLAPRPNAMKMVALLSTPYKYTLYLDGDTAPCVGFQYHIFDQLRYYDILTTPNPLGYESTRGSKTYNNSPMHSKFADFEEINGGILAFKWNNKTEDLLVRALELVPYFATLGYDQDQAMIRHSLFEGIVLNGIKEYKGSMQQYCRTGWNCDHNDCKVGCVMIHQRLCNNNGVSVRSKNDTTECSLRLEKAAIRGSWYAQKNFLLNRSNRKNRAKILNAGG